MQGEGGLPDPGHPVDRVNTTTAPVAARPSIASSICASSRSRPVKLGDIPRQGLSRYRPRPGRAGPAEGRRPAPARVPAQPGAGVDAQFVDQQRPAGPVASSASAWWLDRYRATISCPRSRSRSGCLATSRSSSGHRAACWPSASRASIRSSVSGRRSALRAAGSRTGRTARTPGRPAADRATTTPPPQQRRRLAWVTLLQRVPARGHPLLEHIQIQFAWLDPQQIPGRAGQQPRLVSPPARAWRSRENCARSIRSADLGRLTPSSSSISSSRETTRLAWHNRGQQGPLPRPADVHQRTAAPHLQRPEDPEIQPVSTPPPARVSSRTVALASPRAETALKHF